MLIRRLAPPSGPRVPLLVRARLVPDAPERDGVEQPAPLRGAESAWAMNFNGANLQGADLSFVHLMDATLEGANLRGCNLMRATLNNTRLLDANLRGVMSAETVQTWSAFVYLNGEIKRLEGDALREWLLQAVRME